MKKSVSTILLALILLLVPLSTGFTQNQVVRALLFYSPTCPHCHKVITEDLPLLLQQSGGEPEVLYIPPMEGEENIGPSMVGIFGESLESLYVNTYTEVGNTIYWDAVDRFQIPLERQAVPMLIVGETILLGGNEIPMMFPDIIEQGLDAGGIDWPDITGLAEKIAAMVPVPQETPPTETSSPTETTFPENTAVESPTAKPTLEVKPTATMNNPVVIPPSNQLTVLDRIKLDPVGNSLSIVVLVGMLISLAIAVGRVMLPEEQEKEGRVSWLVPILCLIGLAVAGYLTYVETSGELAVCGPVGDCNTVNQSKYAKLFGLIPVGGIGFAGYIAIILAWLASRYLQKPLTDWAKLALLAMAIFGTAFSTYLTFLEPFVIGATCAWCLTSSIIITLILWLTLKPAIAAWVQVRGMEESISS